MHPAISVRSLSKEYVLGGAEQYRRTFREMISASVSTPLKRLRKLKGDASEQDRFWALQDLNFIVQPGEIVGVIGRNGAGKSTLLKVLSRITQPTKGRIEITGKVASLLEVGTGFHPELTGRENIFLNGAILGMSRRDVLRKFDAIVDFAGVEKFLETPVKRYSSGMYVRLAFAVAAHLEPDVLVVDEVLAVGDAEFQRKCIGKMGDVSAGGRAVLFVSHNMSVIRKLCNRAIYLDRGRIVRDDGVDTVIDHYIASYKDHNDVAEIDLSDCTNRRGSGESLVTYARLLNHDQKCVTRFNRLQSLTLEFTILNSTMLPLNLSLTCMSDDVKVLQMSHQDDASFDPPKGHGEYSFRVKIPELPLQAGEYNWMISIHSEANMTLFDAVEGILWFTVFDDVKNSPRPFESKNIYGYCTQLAHWYSLS